MHHIALFCSPSKQKKIMKQLMKDGRLPKELDLKVDLKKVDWPVRGSCLLASIPVCSLCACTCSQPSLGHRACDTGTFVMMGLTGTHRFPCCMRMLPWRCCCAPCMAACEEHAMHR